MIFISLSNEPERSLTRIRDVLQANRINWLNGWGSYETIVELGTQALPTTYVIGADGRIAWFSDEKGTLESALDRALVRAESKS